jgi:bacteriorhodopsin
VPVSKYFWPAVLLFMLNGAWLVVMMVRSTPPRQ